MALGWTYVALRVLHSFVQATRNVIIVRFFVFAAASLVLLLLLLRTIFLLIAYADCDDRTHRRVATCYGKRPRSRARRCCRRRSWRRARRSRPSRCRRA